MRPPVGTVKAVSLLQCGPNPDVQWRVFIVKYMNSLDWKDCGPITEAVFNRTHKARLSQ